MVATQKIKRNKSKQNTINTQHKAKAREQRQKKKKPENKFLKTAISTIPINNYFECK